MNMHQPLTNQPLLTVIVPCYKVEQYLDKCISSIVSQTYANLEILLIDDGSPDNCGKICDAWQERDKRIRVIHKPNEGLPYARKTGIDNTTGEYVTFVDADDWIHAEMYTEMMSALLSTNSDIAQCGVCVVYEDGRVEHRDNEQRKGNYEIVGRTEGVLLILDDQKWRSWLWCKIFKTPLFEHIQFEKDITWGEDFISHHLFHKASQSVYLHDEYYYYLQRDNALTKQKSLSALMYNHLSYCNAQYQRYRFVEQHPEYHSALRKVKTTTVLLLISFLNNMIALPQYLPKEVFKAKVKQLSAISLKQVSGTVSRFMMLSAKIHPYGYICMSRTGRFMNKITRGKLKSYYFFLSEK